MKRHGKHRSGGQDPEKEDAGRADVCKKTSKPLDTYRAHIVLSSLSGQHFEINIKPPKDVKYLHFKKYATHDGHDGFSIDFRCPPDGLGHFCDIYNQIRHGDGYQGAKLERFELKRLDPKNYQR